MYLLYMHPHTLFHHLNVQSVGKKHCFQFPELYIYKIVYICVSFGNLSVDKYMVSEGEDIMEVSQAISTNFIRQNMENLDICEHSCEQLTSMFQELKGLRRVVGNLMDGLQKVVSCS